MVSKAGRPSSGKGKLITIRLTPKMRYSVELLARVQRRNSITAVIEFAIDKLLQDQATGLVDADKGFLPDLLWDENESTRFVKLCLNRPELLTYDEGVLWRVLQLEKDCWLDVRVPNYSVISAKWDAINEKASKAATGDLKEPFSWLLGFVS
ncbi:MAG: hypothetical protein WCK54_20655, partial [Desulfuromonadales bacterium]